MTLESWPTAKKSTFELRQIKYFFDGNGVTNLRVIRFILKTESSKSIMFTRGYLEFRYVTSMFLYKLLQKSFFCSRSYDLDVSKLDDNDVTIR